MYGQGQETEDRRSFTEQQYVIWIERFRLQKIVTKQIVLKKTWKEPQCEWPLSYPADSLKWFMICIVSTFRKTNGKDGIGLQRIFAYCGSRYLGCTCRLPLWRALRRKRKNTLLPYYLHFRKHVKKNPLQLLKWQKIPWKVQKFTKKWPQNWKKDLKLKNGKKWPINITFL
jgi:hypothetical protein